VTVTERLLGPILADDPARPLITYYDDSDGTRVELSGATLANWAAKTANWLCDDCDVEPGDRVYVRLPAHWQTAGVLLGAWWCGAHLVDEPDGALVSLVSPETTATQPVTDIAAVVALDPLGRGLPSLPADGYLDFISEIRTHGDHFHPVPRVPGDTPALLDLSVDGLVGAATTRAAQLDIGAGDRVLSTVDWYWPDGLLDGLLAVLAAPASLVHCANADPGKLADRRATERVTVLLPRS
jgi:uncharacterized protein (TIGR03089 family)